MSAVLKASRRQDSSERYRALSYCNHLAQDTDSFELLRSVHACVRGPRTPFRSKIEQSLDCKINVASADI